MDAEPRAKICVTCTSLHLKRAARAVAHIMDEYMAPVGLRNGQFGMLISIANEGTISITDLAAKLVMDITTMSRNVKLLERDGLVEVVPGKDRRVRELKLTDLGSAKIADAMPHWEAAQAHIKERLGQDQWADMLTHLQRTASLEATH
jgi:DNA-binding MarR family transcriptional regulator